ncbi:MAG: MFS transporter, partial [Chloroflexi bacterium]|nr:MFS transporter [Chloroflexota bacterium]
IGSQYLMALAYPDFRTLWSASFFAGAAAWALIVARGWLVYELSDSSLWVGLVTFAAMFPRVVVTPFSGYLADRFDRRTVLASMFSVNVVHNLVLGFLVLTGNIEVWHLIVLSMVNGSARAAQMPAAGALVPNLVPKHLLLNAIALNQAAMNGSRLLGPAAIAPMLGTVGVEAAFFMCTGFYMVSLVQTLRIRTSSTGEIDTSRGFVNNMMDGLRYVYRTPVLRAVVLMALFHCGMTMSFESLLPVLSRQQLNAEGAGFSYLMMAVGAGALISSVAIAGIQSEVTRGRLFLNLGVLSGLTPIILGMSNGMPMALLSAVGMGATQAGFMTLTHTMIQSVTPDGVRGRVGGVYSVHIGGMMATANLVNGGLADVVNAPYLLIGGGLVFIVVMFASWQRLTLRRIYTRGLQTEVPSAAA